MTFLLTSDKNIMKRGFSSYVDSLGPNTSVYAYYARTTTIPHNLGYTPFFRVYYTPYGVTDGRIMNCYYDSQSWLATVPNDSDVANAAAPVCLAWADDDNLYIKLKYIDNSLQSNIFRLYYVIYLDYGVS